MDLSRRPQFFARYALLILAAFAFVSPLAARGARRAITGVRNEVKEWLPESYAETTAFNWFRKHFAGEQFVLLSWDGCTLEDARLEEFANRVAPPIDATRPVENGHSLIAEVITGPRLVQQLLDAPSRLKYEDALSRWEGIMIGARPKDGVDEQRPACALVTLSTQGATRLRQSVDFIRQHAEGRREQPVDAALQVIVDGRLVHADELVPGQYVSVITEDRHGKEIVTALRASTEPAEAENAAAAPDADANEPRRFLGLAGGKLTTCGIMPAAIHMGGPPIDNLALDRAGEKSLFRLIAMAAVVGLAVSWWCLRSWRLVFMVFTTGLYATIMALALVHYSGTHADAIMLTMPALVYVAAISGAIHIANYYRESVAEGGVDGAPERALWQARLPLALATGTTAFGLLTLCISELVPIQKFGLYSALGVLATTIPLGLLLPALLQSWPLAERATAPARRSARPAWWTNPIERLPWGRAGNAIVSRWSWVLGAAAVVMLFSAYGVTQIRTSVNLMRFFSSDSEIVGDYAWLEKHLGPLVPMEVVLRFDQELCTLDAVERLQLVQRLHERIETTPGVGGVISAATFGPDGATLGQWRGTVSRQLERSLQKLQEARLLREADGEQMWRISARLSALDMNLDYRVFAEKFQAELEPVLQQEVKKLEAEGQSAGLLPTVYTGLGPLVYKAQHSLFDGMALGFVGDWITIAIVLALITRNIAAGPILMAPAMFPALVVFGTMGWLGLWVDTGAVMAPAVALGVTIDDVVHFLLRTRDALREGKSRREAILEAYRHCAQPMYQSWCVIGLGLSVFAFSPFMPTRMFGLMMVTLLTCSLAGNLVLLPAILASPLGRLFERIVLRGQRREVHGLLERERREATRPPYVRPTRRSPAAKTPPAPHIVQPARRPTESPVDVRG